MHTRLRNHPQYRRIITSTLALGALLALCWGIPAVAQFTQMSPSVGSPVPSPIQALTAGRAVILGIVEGVTEYLPVSSTGHLLLTQHLLGINDAGAMKDVIDAYEIIIQAGAILAVLLLYAGRIRTMMNGVLGRSQEGRQLALNTLVAFVPAAIIGFLAEKYIKQYLFGLKPVMLAWFVGGIVILLVAKARGHQEDDHGKSLEQLTAPQALAIGGLQCFAMWPGVSRSYMAILGGMLVGLSTMAAIEFSFLLGLVTLGAATLYEAAKHGKDIVASLGWINPLIGLALACLSAMVAVRWMVGYLNRHGLAIFGYYRIGLAVLVFGAVMLKLVIG